MKKRVDAKGASTGSGLGQVQPDADCPVSAERVLDGLFAFVGVLSPAGALLQANRAPLLAADIAASDVIGKSFWECFWWSHSSQEQARLKSSVERCAAGETVRYDVDIRIADDRRMRIDFMLAPSHDPEGRITHLIASGVDVSKRHAVENALRNSEERLRFALTAAGAAIWDWDIASQTVYWSQEHWQLYGLPPEVAPSYESWLVRIVPEDRARAEAAVRTMLDGNTDEFQSEFRIRHPERGIRWLLGLGRGERLPDGTLHRLSGITIDITDQKHTEQNLRLLMSEVDHRAKNMLAVVQAMLRLTQADDIAEYRTAVEGRVGALARAHTYLAETRWRGADLHRLVEAELATHAGPDRSRVKLAGPKVLLAPDTAQAAAMAFHELASNAARFGSLSVSDGRLDIGWAVDERGLTLDWREDGGPPPAAPPADPADTDDARSQGLGTILIDRSIGQQLGGEIVRDWSPAGLHCTIWLPAINLADTPREEPEQALIRLRDDPQKRRILIVEDTPLVAMELEQILEEAGYVVIGPAMSLDSGLELAGTERVDAAVLDVNLAGRLVFPLAERLAETGIPILFCTGYERGILNGTAFENYPCIAKPFAAITLQAAVGEILPLVSARGAVPPLPNRPERY